MTRRHRLFHRFAWPVLAFAVASGFILALLLRPPPETKPPAVAQEMRP
jgi:hypothetical protein